MRKRDQKSRREKRNVKSQPVYQGETVVIDFFPQGKSFSSKHSEDYNPVAVVISTDWFQFFDVIMEFDTKISVNDQLLLNARNKRIKRIKRLFFNQLSSSAIENLPTVINEIVKSKESRFVSFLNQAHPLTTQMHQLQLLPGIGQKRMWTILEARKKSAYTSFDDFAQRIGISDPVAMFTNRILLELEESPKYRLFTKKSENDKS